MVATEEDQAGTEKAIRVYSHPLTNVVSLKYFERLLTATDCNFLEVVANLWKSKTKWYRMSRILGR